MGRAAAAGTGLLANVVAGVGTAIGASRNGTDGDSTYSGGGGGSGAESGGERRHPPRTNVDGGGLQTAVGAPLVQLYRRPDPSEGDTERAACGSVATQNTESSGVSYGGSSSCRGAETPTSRGGSRHTYVDAATEVAVGRVPSPPASGGGDNNRGGDFTGDAAGIGGGTERRSALGMASATGGAVLRGLWGGVQFAAAAAAAQGSSGDSDDAAGSGGGREEAGPAPALRLYRRDGDDSS